MTQTHKDRLRVILWMAFAAIFIFAIAHATDSNPVSPIEDATRRLVWITGTEKRRSFSCSGVIIKTNYVLTAAHCEGADMQAAKVSAVVVARDKDADLLLLKTKTLETPRIEIQETLRVGDGVFTVSNYGPWEALYFEGKVAFVGKMTITSIAASPGFSGSGLFDTHGRLVGLNTMFYTIHRPPDILFSAAVRADAIAKFIEKYEAKP